MGGKRANNMSSKLGFCTCVLLINVYVVQLKAFARVCCKYCCIHCLNDEFLTEFSTQDLLSILLLIIDGCFYFASEISQFVLSFIRSLM